MKITSFDTLIVEIPLRMAVRHTLAERRTARNVLVTAHAQNGRSGWGECCPRPYVTGETVESVCDALKNSILPPLLGMQLDHREGVKDFLYEQMCGTKRDEQAAFCAAELAVLDLWGKIAGRSSGEFIGPVRQPKVRYSGVIATEEPKAVEQICGMMRQFQVAAVKIKTGPDLERNTALLTSARTVLGDEVELRIDANCAWDAGEAIRQLEAMKFFALAGVEQPVPGKDLQGMRQVTAAEIVPVVADESLCSLEDAHALISERACDVFNVRISKCGGLLNAVRIHETAIRAGLQCQLGAQVGETGFLSAAGRHYATRCAPIIWHEGSYGTILLEEDIVDPDITVGPGGLAPALEDPGLGIAPRPRRIEAVTSERFSVG
jgi:muconate cycloisomerase